MRIVDKIRGEKLQYDINREKTKILALSWGKIDKYEYLIGEEILSSDESRMTEQAKFNLLKSFKKANKNNWRSRKKINTCYHESKWKTSGFN